MPHLWCVIGAQLPHAEPPVRAEAQEVVAHAQHRDYRPRVASIHAGPVPCTCIFCYSKFEQKVTFCIGDALQCVLCLHE